MAWEVLMVEGNLLTLKESKAIDHLTDTLDQIGNGQDPSEATVGPMRIMVLNTKSLCFHSAEKIEPPLEGVLKVI